MSARPRANENHLSFGEFDNLKKLFGAGARASSLGVALLDSQTRFASVNAALARETRVALDDHMGRTTCELVGEVARPMERVHERVLSSGKAESLLVSGRVRDTPEFGYWLNYCFPVNDRSGRVQQLGLLVVNVTAEKTSGHIFDALATDSKRMMAGAAGLLNKYNEAIEHYYRSLRESFEQLGCPFTATPKKAEHFSASIMRLDNEINTMREMIYDVLSHFSIPEC